LEITVSFLGTHKQEPDIYIGFSLALHLQCGGRGTFEALMFPAILKQAGNIRNTVSSD
jgi:hypothetical protein